MAREGDQRQDARTGLTLKIDWARAGDEVQSSVTGEVSQSGCFVLTSARPQTGQRVKLWLWSLAGEQLRLNGDVIYSLELGFGVRFTGLTPAAQATLAQILAAYDAALAQPVPSSTNSMCAGG